MYRNFLVFAGLISLLLFSCHKNGPDNNDNTNTNDTTTNPPARTWFKLKAIVNFAVSLTNPYYKKDSTEISIDSVNKKVTFKNYNSTTYTKDTSTVTYTYNSNYQLTLYERATSSTGFYMNRMEFVRDASGQVTKVISGYKNGSMATSEGSVKYDKRGDTTFITFLDSVRKHPDYYDGQDFFQVAFLGGKVIAKTSFPIKNKQTDTTYVKYEYDAGGDLVATTNSYGLGAPGIYTYQRSTETPKELQKFMAQWMGDLLWYSRAKFFFPYGTIGTGSYEGFIMGNVVQSIKKDNVVQVSYTNSFDAGGNLASISYQGSYNGFSGIYTVGQRYYYRP